MEGVQCQGEAEIVGEADPKMAKLSDKDDIEEYLMMFGWLMSAYSILEERWSFKLALQLSAYSIPEDRWSFKLALQLVGKAQQAYAAMNLDEAGNYEQLKAAIL